MNVTPERSGGDDEVVFRTLAAPGLDEDDLFAARSPGGETAPWGTGAPSTFAADESVDAADPDAERVRRHRELMAKWAPTDGSP